MRERSWIPHDPDCPVVCMDQPVPATRPWRPLATVRTSVLAGWRRRRRGPGVEGGLGGGGAGLLEGRSPTARGSPWCATLNTHTKGAFEVFEPVRARELVRRLVLLNIAENELSAMTRQCLSGRRIGDLATLHGEVSAWSSDTNDTQRGVDCSDDARCKLKSVYPNILM